MPPVPMDQVDQAILGDKYTLPRDGSERERLDAQHLYLKDVLGGRLIIDTDVKLGQGSRILDSGTGAASWLLDLAKNAQENIEAVGIDISTAMLPKDVPSNVRLYEVSCLNLPEDWTDSFDLVNQRLLIAAFTETQWLRALSELFRVLKPGGAIQLMEVGTLASLHSANLPPATRKAIDYFIEVVRRREILGYAIVHRFPEMLENIGFSDIRVEIHCAPLGKQWGNVGLRGSHNWESIFRSFGFACANDGGINVCKSLEIVDAVVERAKQEWDENPGIFCHIFAITARKPLHADHGLGFGDKQG